MIPRAGIRVKASTYREPFELGIVEPMPTDQGEAPRFRISLPEHAGQTGRSSKKLYPTNILLTIAPSTSVSRKSRPMW
jgi:hypothetical protein